MLFVLLHRQLFHILKEETMFTWAGQGLSDSDHLHIITDLIAFPVWNGSACTEWPLHFHSRSCCINTKILNRLSGWMHDVIKPVFLVFWVGKWDWAGRQSGWGWERGGWGEETRGQTGQSAETLQLFLCWIWSSMLMLFYGFYTWVSDVIKGSPLKLFTSHATCGACFMAPEANTYVQTWVCLCLL